ncbi:structural maintenance of chromosomes protein 6 [Achlya hypogyna]|uniref:Structural maintenance of chromosomes protein 6 n=1 Tax=Achlya hypogyna TaxID=1202772 RepID=A0A1V9YC14_ACHHY|nr:structural maintenance of chromosomes protein 6 [Achlya hypogyna]
MATKARKRYATDAPSQAANGAEDDEDIVRPSEDDDDGVDDAADGDENDDRNGIATVAGGSEMGIIEEIYCENFMCHRRMCVRLCRNINFITGENGSGKSAIIAALQICLGASARSTHRGKSIKNLIRHGHDGNAIVRITLLNDGRFLFLATGMSKPHVANGTDAFRPEQYGKHIMVERVIRRDGSAEYRLKDEHGKLVSKLKADLEAMLDHLNIQIENPCAVLDQENAKLFLKGDPSDKYKFFLQSTDLYKMRATFAKVEDETRMRQESTLVHEEKKLKVLFKAKEEADRLYEEAKSIGHLKEELGSLKQSLAWSFVHAQELTLHDMQAQLDQSLHMQQVSREKVDRRQQMVDARTAEQTDKNNALQALDAEKDALQRQQQTLQQEIRELRLPVQKKHAEKSNLEHQIRSSHARIKRIEHEKATKQAKYQQYLRSLESQQAKQAEAIQAAQEALQAAQARYRAIEAKPMEEFSAALDDIEAQHDACNQQKRDATSEVDRLTTRLRALESLSQNKLVAFGNRVPQLQQLIQSNLRKFTAPPIGPLGMYANLRPEFQDYAVAVELVLKNVIGSYLVVNGKDKALLDSFKRQLQMPGNQAPIVIAPRRGRKYDNLRLPEGRLGAHSVVSLLDVEDADVFNALVDVASIEGKLVYPTRQEAERETMEGDPGRQRFARFVSEVYLPNGDKLNVRNGNVAYIANKGQRHARILSQDSSAEIGELQHRLGRQKEQLQHLVRDEQRLRAQREGLRKQQHQHTTELDAASRNVHRAQTELSALQRQTTDPSESTLDTALLDEELADLTTEIQQAQAALGRLEADLTETNPELQAKEQALAAVHEDGQRLDARLRELQQSVTTAMAQLSSATAKLLRAKNEAKEAACAVAAREAEVAEQQAIVATTTTKATAFCPRVEACTEPPAFYSQQIKDMQVRMEREKQRFDNMDLDDLLVDKEDKCVKYVKKNAEFTKFSENVATVATMLATRKRKWENLRIEIANRTSIGFNKFMQAKNFAGKLKFLHDEQRLDINVMANEAGKTKQSMVSDMKQLSGGERSYTQVALLMALGECIESPFRVMDEFDVFMDSINRTHTLQLLVETSKQASRKQFIFVTPNDLSSVKEDAMVKIQKLNPPRDRLTGPMSQS